MAEKRTATNNLYAQGIRTIPTKTIRNSENEYRKLRGEHPAWVGKRWFPPDHAGHVPPAPEPDRPLADELDDYVDSAM